MKRDGITIGVLGLIVSSVILGAATTANGAKIKFRNSTPTPRAVMPGDEETGHDANDAAKDKDAEQDAQTNVEKVDDESVGKESPQKTPSNLGVLIAPPENARDDAKQRKERPVVQEAMRMTLEELVPTKLLRDPRVLRAFARTPRVEFVPKKRRELAYLNTEVPLENGRALESPFDDAYLCEAISPEDSDRVLVVEPGAGYFTAALSELVGETYLVGIDKNLTRRAAPILKSLGYSNVYVRLGDLETGWLDQAPFDKIVVLCGVPEIPQGLIEQLKDGGKIVAPIGDSLRQTVTLGEKSGETMSFRPLAPVSLDMEPSFDAKRKGIASIQLIGGDFETLDPAPSGGQEESTIKPRDEASKIQFAPLRSTPTGWFDGRLFEIVEGDAFEGARSCLFDNAIVRAEQIKKEKKDARVQAATLPEERKNLTEYGQAVRDKQLETELISQLRQRLPLDGAVVKKAIFSGAYRVERIMSSDQGVVAARVLFYDKDRREIEARDVLKCSSTTAEWREFSEEIQVPFRAKSAVVVVGILDGIGTVRLDSLQIRNKADRSQSLKK